MMAASNFRSQVLASFKKLHQTRMSVFKDDKSALTAARERINEEFKKNKCVTNASSINELVLYAQAVEVELRTSVVQAREVKQGHFEARITADTNKLNNMPFKDCPA